MFLIHKIIYLYLFVCVTLLIFNILYILRSDRDKRRSEARTRRWKEELDHTAVYMRERDAVQGSHLKLVVRQLRNTEELIAYYNALFSGQCALNEEELNIYFSACRSIFPELAMLYQKRNSMERAFFAYVVSVCFQYGDNFPDQTSEILLSYLEDSTIYCRERVLEALYSIGDSQAVEQAFEYISAREWYHNSRLISDGLQKFRGDKRELVLRLWKHYGEWEEEVMIGVLQFATNVSGSFRKEFYQELTDPNVPSEIRLALMRYFRRYPDQKSEEYLIKLLCRLGKESDAFSIVAASALSSFPSENVKAALKKAMHDQNWYVRRNAAMSLQRIGITKQDEEEIRESRDRYACEMLDYIVGKELPLTAG